MPTFAARWEFGFRGRLRRCRTTIGALSFWGKCGFYRGHLLVSGEEGGTERSWCPAGGRGAFAVPPCAPKDASAFPKTHSSLERKRKVVFHEGTTMLTWQEGGKRTKAVLHNAVIAQGSFLKPEYHARRKSRYV